MADHKGIVPNSIARTYLWTPLAVWPLARYTLHVLYFLTIRSLARPLAKKGL
jgi:hypothetical protein